MNDADRIQLSIDQAVLPVRVRLHDSSEAEVDAAVLHDDIDGTYVLILLKDGIVEDR
jgi:hypothetical protein